MRTPQGESIIQQGDDPADSVLTAGDCYDLLMKAWEPMKEEGVHVHSRSWPKDGDFEEVEAVVVVARGDAATLIRDYVRDEVPAFDTGD